MHNQGCAQLSAYTVANILDADVFRRVNVSTRWYNWQPMEWLKPRQMPSMSVSSAVITTDRKPSCSAFTACRRTRVSVIEPQDINLFPTAFCEFEAQLTTGNIKYCGTQFAPLIRSLPIRWIIQWISQELSYFVSLRDMWHMFELQTFVRPTHWLYSLNSWSISEESYYTVNVFLKISQKLRFLRQTAKCTISPKNDRFAYYLINHTFWCTFTSLCKVLLLGGDVNNV